MTKDQGVRLLGHNVQFTQRRRRRHLFGNVGRKKLVAATVDHTDRHAQCGQRLTRQIEGGCRRRLAQGRQQRAVVIAVIVVRVVQPRRRLLDVRSARFQSAASTVLQYFTVSHNGAVRGDRPICAGLYTCYDHNHNQFWEGLTYGGRVQVTAQYAYTHVAITSPAPILILMGDADPIQHLLFDELMAVVARHRAEARESDSEYARRLACADPYQLFLAALVKLHALAKHGPPSMAGARHLEVQRSVQRMIDAVRALDGWPDQVPALEDLV